MRRRLYGRLFLLGLLVIGLGIGLTQWTGPNVHADHPPVVAQVQAARDLPDGDDPTPTERTDRSYVNGKLTLN